MSGNLVRMSILLAAVLLAATASASVHPFVMDGQLLIAERSGDAVQVVDLPVDPLMAFGSAGDQVLVTVEHAAPKFGSDIVGGEMNLWVTDRHGEARQLTEGQIVMSALWNEALGRVFYWTLEKKVYALDLTSGTSEVLLENAITPALSPSGRELAYVLTPEDWAWDYHAMTFELHVRDLITGEDRNVFRGGDASEPIWTPDGRYLIFQSGGMGVTSLWRVPAQGGDADQLTNHGLWTAKSEYFVMNPSRNTDVTWSEDGRNMLFGASYSEAGEVMVVEFDAEYKPVRALELAVGHHPFWSDKSTVLVPRRELSNIPRKTEVPVRFAEFVVDQKLAHHVVDVANAPRELELPAELKAGLEAEIPTKACTRYRFPIHDSCGYPYTAYYDDSGYGGGLLDWKCGTYTYDNHKGTDLGLYRWWVYAGGYGTLWSWNDGCPTVGYYCSSCGGGFGNYIKLNHGSDGSRYWYTTYAHFVNGTVSPSAHSCGDRIGITGSSGCSTGYHLHFQVDAYGHPWDDPFSGSCSGPVSYWCNQNGGYPTMACCC